MIGKEGILISFSISSKAEVTEFTVSASLTVAEVCLDNFSFKEGIDLMCLAIKLLFSSIQQWQNDAIDSQTEDEENKTDGRKYLKKEYVRKLTNQVLSKLKSSLSPDMSGYYRSDALSRELEVRLLNNVIVI